MFLDMTFRLSVSCKRDVMSCDKELHRLVEGLREWLESAPAPSEPESRALLEREAEVERVQELCAELRAQRVSFPERAAADVCAAWTRYVATRQPGTDAKAKHVSDLTSLRTLLTYRFA